MVKSKGWGGLAIFLAAAASGVAIGQAPGPVLIPNVVTTVAGNAQAPSVSQFSGDGGLATAASLNWPANVIADSAGNLYIVDSQSNVIREVNAQTGIITTVAGVAPATGCSGTACFITGYSGDGGPATSAKLTLSTSTGGGDGLAVDALGNLYFVDSPGSGGVLRVVYKAGAQLAATIATLDPTGVTTSGGVVKPGYIYALVNPTGAAHGTPPSPNAPQAPSAARFYGMTGVALDSVGNLYLADGDSNLRVLNTQSTPITVFGVTIPSEEIEVVVGNPTGTPYVAANAINNNSLGTLTTLRQPRGLYADTNGNLYYVGNINGSGVAVVYAGGSAVASLIAKLNPTLTATVGQQYLLAGNAGIAGNTATTNFNVPANTYNGFTTGNGQGTSGLAVDSSGNFYVTDIAAPGVFRVDANTGSITLIAGSKTLYASATPSNPVYCSGSSGPQTTDTIGDGCSQGQVATQPLGVALDAAGNLYIADRTYNTIRKASIGTQFPAAAAGSAAAVQQTIRMKFYSNNLPATANPFKIGAGPGDFTLVGTPSCTAALADGTEDCLITVAFNPVGPGARSGALLATDAAGTVHRFGLTGVGTAPAIAIDSAAGTAIGTGFASPASVAVDPLGDIYVADTANNRIVEVPAGGSTPVTVVSAAALVNGTALSAPAGVAIDATGNVYIADKGNNRVLRLAAGATVPTALPGSYSSPSAVAVDPLGNVYVADTGNKRVVTLAAPPIFGAFQPGIVATGTISLSNPVALAVDRAGNLYIADAGLKQVVEVSPSDIVAAEAGKAVAPAAFGADFSTLSGVAVDAAGTVYVDDAGTNTITAIVNGGTANVVQTVLPLAGLAKPAGIALDTSANLYVADTNNNRIVSLNRNTVSLLYTAVPAGSVTPAQTASISDAGTQPLVLTGLTVSPSFQQSGTSTSCSSTSQLTPGANCTVTVAFAPTAAASANGAVTLTDNAGNRPASTQSIQLLAIGSKPQTITFGCPPPTSTYGQTVTVSATASSGLPVYFNTAGPATPSGSTISLTGTGTVTVTATQPGSAVTGYAAAPPAVCSIAVSPAPLTIVANNIGIAVGTSLPPYTYYIVGFVNGDSQASVLTGSPSLTTNPAAPSAVGSYPITISAGTLVNSSGDYTFSFVNGTLTIASNSQTITFPPLSSSGSVSYGVAPLALAATASSGLPITYAVSGPAKVVCSSGTCATGSGYVLQITGAGTVTVTATQAGSGTTYPLVSAVQIVTVSKAVLTYTANNQTVVYGQPLPAYTATPSGFVNGETSAVVTGSPVFSTTTAPVAVGTYPIVIQAGTLSAANYTFATVNGTLTITPAPLTLTIGSASVVYGAAVPTTYTSTASGLVNGDTLGNDVSVSFALTPVAVQGSPAGTYSVGAVLGGSAAANYALTVVPGKLTITPLAVTATAFATSFPYGGSVPQISGTITGLLSQDAGKVIAYFTTNATSTSPVGSYPITAVTLGGPAAGNYSVSSAGQVSLTIVQAGTITVVASAVGSAGGTNPSVTLTATITPATSGTPTGTVTFYDSGVAIPSPVTLNGGIATLTTTSFTTGSSHFITAGYNGDTNFQISSSAVLVVTPGTPGYTFTGQSTLTVQRGTLATIPLILQPVGGYAGTVTFSCSGLPQLSTCVFAPANTTLSGTSVTPQTISMSITTVGPTSYGYASMHNPTPARTYAPAAWALLLPAGLLPLCLANRRRWKLGKPRVWSTVAVLVLLGGLAGCGSNGGIYTATGTYQVTITAAGVPNAGSSVPASSVVANISVTITP